MSDIWDLPTGKRIIVKINNDSQPIGDESCALTHFIGTMVRMPDFAPIYYKNWHEMPNNKKEEMWKTVELKFQFKKLDSEDHVDEATMEKVKLWVLLNMNTKWRQWKNELKSKIYDEHQTSEEMFANLNDPRVNINQLKILASYWLTDKAKEQSETNKTNRSKLDEPHCTGTRSFSRIVEALTEESNGVAPTRAEMYIQTRTRKDGNIVNDKAARVVELLKEGINESSSQNLEGSSWRDDVLSKVRGPDKKGHVRCMGMIAAGSSDRSGPSSFQSNQQNEEMERMKAELEGLKKTLSTFISLFQQQYPNANMPRIEVPDAGSAPNISQRNNRSAFASHQPTETGQGGLIQIQEQQQQTNTLSEQGTGP